MSNENFRRELNAEFEQMSGPPSPALRDRVRSSIAQAPEAQGRYWIAAVAAVVVAVLIVGVLYVTNPLHRPPISSGPVVTSPSPSASPSSSPTPSYACGITDLTNPPGPPVAFIDAVRTGTHSGYDRLTVEFQNGAPSSVELRPQSGTSFTQGASGQQVTLAGKNGILVVIHGADLHTSYSGPTDIKTGYSALVEVRSVEDFEGTVQLALGINGPACYKVSFLSNPSRLVIDISTATG